MSAFIVIHGRRQIGTNARSRSGSAARKRRRRRRRCRRRGRAPASAGATSSTGRHAHDVHREAGALRARRSPPCGSPRRSPRRGPARATRSRSMSGSFVPPTCGELGVLAEARDRDRSDVPREQRLGDRRDEADDAHYSRLSSSAFFASYSACVIAPLVSRSCSFASCSVASARRPTRQLQVGRRRRQVRVHGGGGTRTGRSGGSTRRLLLVLVRLLVDLLRDELGLAHVAEAALPVLAAGLDQQVAGADHALPDRLLEVHVHDPLERDLDAGLRRPCPDGR